MIAWLRFQDEGDDEMTDDTLEAQAREFLEPLRGEVLADEVMSVLRKRITAWARHLVAESRAGALTPETIDRMARAMYAVKYPKQAEFYDSGTEKTREEYRKMVRAALAAEAEPGARKE